ncbi:hypothetical protein [Novilysobacter arseniciresistens]|uniref:hypothetical protein n=1 Tax=Novilysobacter arseniciresistens TaxID=1385522 RepID=UPI000AC13D87|nr:hypothetical protein [Lysobacter arseniciresistens]
MLKVEITIEGNTWSDVELAIEEAKRRMIDQGPSWLGFDENDTGSFHYEVDGDEETNSEEEDED